MYILNLQKEKESEELLSNIEISGQICYICSKMIRDDESSKMCCECSKSAHTKCLSVKHNCDEQDLQTEIKCDECQKKLHNLCKQDQNPTKPGVQISVITLPVEGKAGFTGPVQERKCTDMFFLFFKIATMIAFFIIMMFCLAGSNPMKYIYGTDSCGNICGFYNDKSYGNPNPQCNGGDFTNRRLVMFKEPLLDPTDIAYNKRECVSTCPTDMVQVMHFCMRLGNWTTRQTNMIGNNIEVAEHTKLMNNDHNVVIFEEFGEKRYSFQRGYNGLWSLYQRGNVNGDKIYDDSTGDVLQELRDSFTWFTNERIFQLFALCLGISFIVLMIVSLSTKVFIWTVVILLYILLIITTCFLLRTCVYEYNCEPEVTCSSRSERFVLVVMTIIMTQGTIMGFYKFNPLRSRNQIKRRINMLAAFYSEAGNFLGSVPSIMLLPILTMLFVGVAVWSWLRRTLIIETMGQVAEDNQIYITNSQTMARVLSILTAIWGIQFIVNCQDLVIAGAVSQWYFARDKSMVKWPVIKSLYRLIRYHLGSVLLGSLVLYPMTFVFYLIKSLIKFHRNTMKDLKKVFYLFLMMVIKTLGTDMFHVGTQLTSNQSYVQTAIYSRGFFKSYSRALSLQCKYMRDSVSIVTFGVVFVNINKAIVTAIVYTITVVGMGSDITKMTGAEDSIYTILTVRVIVITLFAYYVGHTCISVFQIVTDAIYICFLEDCENNDGSKSYHMNKQLEEFIVKRNVVQTECDDRNQTKSFYAKMMTGLAHYQPLYNAKTEEKQEPNKY